MSGCVVLRRLGVFYRAIFGLGLGLALGFTLISTVAAQTLPKIPSINSTSQGRAKGTYTPVPLQTFTNDGLHRILVSNDLGMHCSDVDQRISSILPPFNVLHAQVLTMGAKPVLMNSTQASVLYSAASNSVDPVLTSTSPTLANNGAVYKSGFWGAPLAFAPFYPSSVLASYFPANAARTDVGLPVVDAFRLYLGDQKLALTQQAMPSVTAVSVNSATQIPTKVTASPFKANTPQAFKAYEPSFPFFDQFSFGYNAQNTNWFAAEGIPIAPFDDVGRENPFPLMRVQAKSLSTKTVIASLDVVVPVSSETNCKNCHLTTPDGDGSATRRVSSPKVPSNDPTFGKVPLWASQKWAADINILRLHDLMHSTTLYQGYNASTGLAPKPVVCQTCHYTPALDLAQVGPQNNGNGLTQIGHQSMSRVMHAGHGRLMNGPNKVFPDMPPPNDASRINMSPNPLNATTQTVLEQTCYECHPGKRTKCLRGPMLSQAGAVCQDCHGQMTQVGNDFSPATTGGNFTVRADYYSNSSTPRVPWLNEPTCGSCHTGDAVSNMTQAPGAIASQDSIRLLQAYLTTDSNAKPILPTNSRFAEPRVLSGPAVGNPQLFRLSTGHGGIFCEGCHGATHAEWPNASANANDNLAATQLQGHAGAIIECNTCHTGSMSANLNGPHGMHPVGNSGLSANWVSSHGDFAEGKQNTCKACHGKNGEGSVLSKVAVTRTNLKCESGAMCANGAITLPAGYKVTCTTCHDAGGGGNDGGED